MDWTAASWLFGDVAKDESASRAATPMIRLFSGPMETGWPGKN